MEPRHVVDNIEPWSQFADRGKESLRCFLALSRIQMTLKGHVQSILLWVDSYLEHVGGSGISLRSGYREREGPVDRLKGVLNAGEMFATVPMGRWHRI
jgi:hypothetical protein